MTSRVQVILGLGKGRENGREKVGNILAKVAKIATDERRSNKDEPHVHVQYNIMLCTVHVLYMFMYYTQS